MLPLEEYNVVEPKVVEEIKATPNKNVETAVIKKEKVIVHLTEPFSKKVVLKSKAIFSKVVSVVKSIWSSVKKRELYLKWFFTEFTPTIIFYGSFASLFLFFNGFFTIDLVGWDIVFGIIGWGFFVYFMKAEIPKMILHSQHKKEDSRNEVGR